MRRFEVLAVQGEVTVWSTRAPAHLPCIAWWPVTLVLLMLVLLLAPTSAIAKQSTKRAKVELPPTQQTLSVVGFCNGGREVILEVLDENIGELYQVRDVRRGKVIASYPFGDGTARRAWSKVKRKHSVQEGFSDTPDNPKKRVTMMSTLGKGALRVMVMRGEVIKPYTTIPLYVGRDKKTADAFVKQIVWDARGKHAVVIYHQATKGRMQWAGDFMHGIKYKSYRAGCEESP